MMFKRTVFNIWLKNTKLIVIKLSKRNENLIVRRGFIEIIPYKTAITIEKVNKDGTLPAIGLIEIRIKSGSLEEL